MSKLNVVPQDSEKPWYHQGLRFKCTGCGKCCTGTPGFVWVSENEMEDMAASLNMSLDLFKRKYTRQRANRYALIEKKIKGTEDHACVFLKDRKCMVYQARPTQCKTFPWWPENLNSQASWQLAAAECEGINDQAPVVSFTKINEALKQEEECL